VDLHNKRRILILLAAVLLGYAALGFDRGLTSKEQSDRDAFLGTWTEEGGEPGNSIRFYLVPREIPGVPAVVAYEGHVTFRKQLGADETKGTWGFESWSPLRLSVSAGDRYWFVAVRVLDPDHILIRLGGDIEEMSRPDVFANAETKALTRVRPKPGAQ
jgi:hypothetical protein